MKLHLGCGNKKIHGFTNVDIRPEVNPDVVDDIFTLEKFENNSVDLIYCVHVLEHLDKHQHHKTLLRWYNILKDKGVLRLAVPDMEVIFAHYFYHKDLTAIYSALWGSQRHPNDYHKWGWTFETLEFDLQMVGFRDIGRYDWKTTEHSYVDDYSQTYYPEKNCIMKNGQIQKIKGKLMSLNVEAIK